MGRKSILIILGTIVVFGTGCPQNLRSYRFTSADPGMDSALLGGRPLAVYEGTGTQADASREVVEPDVYHRQDNLLYVLNQYRGLGIIDLETNTILAQVPTYGSPRDLYVRGTRAFVIVAYATDYEIDGNTVSYTTNSRLYVVDIADPAQAAIVSSFDLDGDLVDSRLVGDVLYPISSEYQYYWVAGGQAMKTAASESWVKSVNVADPANIVEVDEVSFAGMGDVIHATETAIFVAASDWSTDTTRITYVDISDPAGAILVRGFVDVAGTVADRFKMDAYAGYLRVVSYARADERRVYVTTIGLANPDALAVAATTEVERATGERLFATRFDGERAYIVTYLVVDPLFVVDLSDPLNPRVTGELEVPGWSTHIEPRGDRLIALGVDDTDGSRKVCVSLFDVSDPTMPVLLDRERFGDEWSWSTAHHDVKAFTVMDDILIVPVNGYDGGRGWYERLQFVSHTPDTLTTRGSVELAGQAVRSFQYGEAFYGLGTEQLVTVDASDLDAPQVVNRLVLAENVADFVELSPSVGAEIITSAETGLTTVRPLGLPLKSSAQVQVDIGSLADAYARDGCVVLVGRTYGQEPEYRVAIVDCTDPGSPQAGDVIRVRVTPMDSWRWWPYDIAYAGAVDKMILPHPVSAQSTTFLVGDRLVLRCLDGEYDAQIGGAQATQGYAAVDLVQRAWTSTIGLGFENIVSMDASGGKLYVGSTQGAGRFPFWEFPLASYFVTEVDPVGPSAGPTVNVPGRFVQYDAEGDVLVLQDQQWDAGGGMDVSLESVAWDGGTAVTPVDSFSLPSGVGDVLGRGGLIFFSIYSGGSSLIAVRVDASGNLVAAGKVLVTEQWANLLDAADASAFMAIGGGAIARYDFSSAVQLTDLVEVMGSPWRMHFGAQTAYVPLGYYGVASLPR